MTAPAAKPTSDSAPTISPWTKPHSAIAMTKTTMSQSSAVTAMTHVTGSMVRPDGYVDATLGVTDHRRERRRRLTRRGLPLLAVVSLVAGLVIGARSQPAAERAGHAFAVAWQHGDLGTMYSLLTPEARSRTSGSAFAAAYRQATATATLRKLVVMHVHSSG